MNRLVYIIFLLLATAIPAWPAGQKVAPIEVKDCAPDLVQKVGSDGLLTCAPGVAFANPTAIASDVVVNGVLTTAMRSDAAPPVQLGTAAQKGVVQVDGTTIIAAAGIISATPAAAGGVTGLANPTATAGPTAINGAATTAMRSDAAPAVQIGSNSQKGILQVDGTTITEAAGVISSAAGTTFANPSATAGPTAVNGAATTAMRSDAAPAVQLGSASQKGIVQVDGTTITAAAGVISSVGGVTSANPTATAGPTAVNGSAATFMRSDGAPAVQQGSSSQKGIVQVDGTTITASSGVISAVGTGVTKAIESIGWIATANPNNAIMFTAPVAATLTNIVARVTTPVGATATISVFKAPGGTACPSGTNLIAAAATVDANATANTNISLTLAGAGAPSLAAGDSVCLSTSNGTNFSLGSGIGGITVAYTVP